MPDDDTEERLRKRFLIAVELAETGIAIKRQNLRRKHPDATEDEIDRMLRDWRRRRPPDSPGHPRRIA